MLVEPLTLGIVGVVILAVLVVIGMHVAYAGALIGLLGLVVVQVSLGVTSWWVIETAREQAMPLQHSRKLRVPR